MQCDPSIMELETERAKALLSFLQNKLPLVIDSREPDLKPISRVFYTHMGTLGFISEAYYFHEINLSNFRLNLSNPFQVILVPNQTVSLYKAVHDTSSDGLDELLNDTHRWSFAKVVLNNDLTAMAFKNEYIYCGETSKKYFWKEAISFVYIPELENILWETMQKVDSFYFEKIRERVPNYSHQDERGPEVIEGDASETGIVPFNETGMVHLIGFRPNVPVKRE